MTAIELLEEQHREVEDLFEQFETLDDDDEAGREALFTGDVFHHPIELLHPEIDANTCEHFPTTVETRKRLIARCVESGALLIQAHFAPPHVGFVRRENGAVRFEALTP